MTGNNNAWLPAGFAENMLTEPATLQIKHI